MRHLHSTITLLALLVAFYSSNSVAFTEEIGGYVIHYSSLRTEFLASDVAKRMGVRQKNNRAFLNVVVFKRDSAMPNQKC